MSLEIKVMSEAKSCLKSLISERDGALGSADAFVMWFIKSRLRGEKPSHSACSFREEKIYKDGRKKKRSEDGREGDFTCIPEATARRFTLCRYVLSLTSWGCHGNQAISVGWAVGIGPLSHGSFGCLPFISVPAVLMCKEDVSWEMKKDDWLFVFQQGLNLASCTV